MSITRINRELGLLVWLRADSRCEYCGMPQQFDDLTFEIDHVVAEQHGGKTTPANLALACFSCNRRKGSNLGGILAVAIEAVLGEDRANVAVEVDRLLAGPDRACDR